jgi:Na+-transporting methylmalonyl-CoA/oxaloacetate decarboxylase beta subunit
MKKQAFAAGIAGCAAAVGLLIWRFSEHRGDAASVGIIGGADGPTAIFVADRMNGFLPALVLALAALLAVLCAFFFRRKRGE